MDFQETPVDFKFETSPQTIKTRVTDVTEGADIITENGHFKFRFRHRHTPSQK